MGFDDDNSMHYTVKYSIKAFRFSSSKKTAVYLRKCLLFSIANSCENKTCFFLCEQTKTAVNIELRYYKYSYIGKM